MTDEMTRDELRAGVLAEGDLAGGEVPGGDLVDPYSRRLGERLRSIRHQKHLSLNDVETASDVEFKASVLGAYERGERSISIPRLHRLSAFYDVPIDQMLPSEDGDDDEVLDLTDRSLDRRRGPAESRVVLDLVAMGDSHGEDMDMLARYVRTIQVQRQDFNGRMLSLRRDDLRAIACILGIPADQAVSRLRDLGLSRVDG